MKYTSGILKKPSAKKSEDIIGFNNDFYWILDGATPPSGEKNTFYTQKFVNLLNAYLSFYSIKCETPKELLEKSLKRVIDDFDQEKIDKSYMPYSTAIILKINNDEIDYLVLGDSYLYIENRLENRLVVDNRLKKIAQSERELVQALRAKGVSEDTDIYKEARRSLIEKEREQQNVEGGYWVAGFNKLAAHKGVCGNVKIDSSTMIFALTDGLARLVTHLNSTENILSIANEIKAKGSLYVFNKLRVLELNPDNFKKPISSKHDDASFFLIDFKED